MAQTAAPPPLPDGGQADDAGRGLGDLVAGVRGLLESLPSPHARALTADLARASTPVAAAFRDRVRAIAQSREDLTDLVSVACDLLEALPSPHARALASDLARARTPLSAALRERAATPLGRPDSALSAESADSSVSGAQSRPASGAPASAPALAPTAERAPDGGQQLLEALAGQQQPLTAEAVSLVIQGEGEVASYLVQKLAGRQWPYTPGSAADAHGRDTLHAASAKLVREGQKLLENLSDDEAAKVLVMMLESDSVLAAAMRSRMPAADHARLFLPSERPSSALDELVREGEALLDMMPEAMATELAEVIKNSDGHVAQQLRAKSAEGKSRATLALRDLAAESKQLISGLPDHLATDLLRATMDGENAISAALRQQLFELAAVRPDGEDDSLLQHSFGSSAFSAETGAWSGASRKWWRMSADKSFDSVLSQNATIVHQMKDELSNSRASSTKARTQFLNSMNDTAQWFSSRIRPAEKSPEEIRRQESVKNSVRAVSFFLMLQSSVRKARIRYEQELKEQAEAERQRQLKLLNDLEDQALQVL